MSLDPTGASREAALSEARGDKYIEHRIAAGVCVLVARGNAVGAFVLSPVAANKEDVTCEWAWRADGLGRFRAGQFQRGSMPGKDLRRGSRQIEFGPFSFECQPQFDPGFLYVRYSADRSIYFSVTEMANIQDVDAFAATHVYTAFVGDPGSVFAADAASAPKLPVLRAVPADASAASRAVTSGSSIRMGVEDGAIVLLYASGAFGALQLTNQRTAKPGEPDTAHVEWRYRRDANGALDPPGGGIHVGQADISVTNRTAEIRFGPFLVYWDPRQKGEGLLQVPADSDANITRIYVAETDRDSFGGLDARSDAWIYHRREGDAGWRFESASPK